MELLIMTTFGEEVQKTIVDIDSVSWSVDGEHILIWPSSNPDVSVSVSVSRDTGYVYYKLDPNLLAEIVKVAGLDRDDSSNQAPKGF